MKVLQVNDHCVPMGGAERYMLDVCAALEGMGHQVVLLSHPPAEGGSLPPWRVHFVEASDEVGRGLRALREVIRVVREEDPDVVHLHNVWRFPNPFVSPLVVSAIGWLRPTVRFVHDVRSLCPNGGLKAIALGGQVCDRPAGWGCFRGRCRTAILQEGGYTFDWNVALGLAALGELKASRRLDRLIVGSDYMRRELLRNGFPPERVVLIPCYRMGIAEEEAVPFLENRGRVVLCVGRLDEAKGIDQFVRALALIREKAWRAEVVGEGPQAAAFSRLAEELGLEGRIRFRGRVVGEELENCYRRATLLVVPSRVPESFGLVGIEALSHGRPVVAFDLGGVREWLVDGETGFLVEHGDLEGLARRIGQLLEEPELARRLGLAGKERVEGRFRREVHLGRLVQVYAEVIGERALGRRKR